MWKDIVIAVFVGYFALDIALGYSNKSSTCAESLLSSVSNQNGLVAIIVAVIVAIVVWYLSSRSRECFKSEIKEDEK